MGVVTQRKKTYYALRCERSLSSSMYVPYLKGLGKSLHLEKRKGTFSEDD